MEAQNTERFTGTSKTEAEDKDLLSLIFLSNFLMYSKDLKAFFDTLIGKKGLE